MNLNSNTRSVILMNIAMLTFTVNDTGMKVAMESLPFFQAVALRGVICTLALGAIAWQAGSFSQNIPRREWGRLTLRTLAEVGSTVAFLMALSHMPLPNMVAVMQSLPLVLTLAAAVLFGETLGWRRISAVLVGLLGVMIILRPGLDGFDTWALMALVAVAAVALRDLITRGIGQGVSSPMIAFLASLAVTVMGGVGVIVEGWHEVSAATGATLVLSALSLVVAYLAVVPAMRIGDVGLVSTFRYMALVWAILLGGLVFGDWPDGIMLAGAALVVGSGIFTLWRERQLARRLGISVDKSGNNLSLPS